jgi:hypothetical protein
MRYTFGIFLFLLSSCIIQDKHMIKKVAKDLNGGKIGFYRIEVGGTCLIKYRKYIDLVLDNQGIFQLIDSANVYNAAAYRLYVNLRELDRVNYEAIRVTLRGNILSQKDTTNFYSMTFLQDLYKSEKLVKKYFQAFMDNDTSFVYREFDTAKLKYSKTQIDSLNKFLSKRIKHQFEKSKLYLFQIVEDENEKYKMLVFLADTSDIYDVKFQIDLHDSIIGSKDIVNIRF